MDNKSIYLSLAYFGPYSEKNNHELLIIVFNYKTDVIFRIVLVIKFTI